MNNVTMLDSAQFSRLIRGIVEQQACRTVAHLHILGAGLKLSPEASASRMIARRALELAEHYEDLSRLYEHAVHARVETYAGELVAKLADPEPQTFYEFTIANFLRHRANLLASAEHEDAAFGPLANMVRSVQQGAHEHQAFAERLFLELTLSRAFEDQKQALFERWLARTLQILAGVDAAQATEVLRANLRKREPSEVAADFLEGLRPTMKAAGISFPAATTFGDLLPPFTDLSLDGVESAKARAITRDDRQTLAGVPAVTPRR